MRIFAVGKLPTPTPTLTPSPRPCSGHRLAKACRLSVSHSHLSPRGCPGTRPTVPSRMPLNTGASWCPRMGALQGAGVGWSRVGRSIVWAAPRICWHLSQGCYPLRWSSVPSSALRIPHRCSPALAGRVKAEGTGQGVIPGVPR